MIPSSLDQYLIKYGPVLGKKIQESAPPIHNPMNDAPSDIQTKRSLLQAQAHVVSAVGKLFDSGMHRGVMNCGLGTGKTIMSIAAIHAHAKGRYYRGVVVCPSHIAPKWVREIKATIEAEAVIVGSIAELREALRSGNDRPLWVVMTASTAKLGTSWKPSAIAKKWEKSKRLYCPKCGEQLVLDDSYCSYEDIERNRTKCSNCGECLWQHNHDFDRWPLANYIAGKLRHKFRYLIVDEAHQAKGDDTAIGVAVSRLISSTRYTLMLTATILGGYAHNLRSLIWRIAPWEMVDRGMTWDGVMDFNRRYGRIETTVTEIKSLGSDNKQSKNGKRTQKISVRPGIMPSVFELLMPRTVFLELSEMADDLPKYTETVLPVDMDAEQSKVYEEMEKAMKDAVKSVGMMAARRLVGKQLHTLVGWPDHPYDMPPMTYYNPTSETFIEIFNPPSLSKETIRPKEQALIDLVISERSQGRQVWVYTPMSGKYDVVSRLSKLLSDAGLRVAELRASVAAKKREAWMEKNYLAEVVVSHPQLVETGVDFFDKKRTYNFSTIVFYGTGWSLYTMRQAAGRHWRVSQTMDCRTVFMHYTKCMQERAILLMGQKLSASMAVEGKFSSEGLLAMAGDDSMEMALAKSLTDSMDSLESGRVWERATFESVAPSATDRPIVGFIPPKAKPKSDATMSQKDAIRKIRELF